MPSIGAIKATRNPLRAEPKRRNKAKNPGVRIVLDELDFSWTDSDEQKVVDLWDSGASIMEIAKVRKGKYKQEEVFMLLLDLVLSGKIKYRPGGVFGG